MVSTSLPVRLDELSASSALQAQSRGGLYEERRLNIPIDVTGGAFRRISVPPGDHDLRFSTGARPPLTDLRILMRGPPEVVTKQIEGMAGPIITFDPPARPFARVAPLTFPTIRVVEIVRDRRHGERRRRRIAAPVAHVNRAPEAG